LALISLLLGACAGAQNEMPRPPLRLVMLDTNGVVMAGYTNIPHLPSVGAEIGQDVRYWVDTDGVNPTLFVASLGSVDGARCIEINSAFVGADYLPARRVCGLAAADSESGCTTYRYSDAVYGRGVVVESDVALQWHLAFDEQARVGDCIVDAVVASVERERLTPHAWRILTDYVGTRRAADR